MKASAAAEQQESMSTLSMYDKQPNDEVTLHDFEVLALDRLRGKWAAVPFPMLALVRYTCFIYVDICSCLVFFVAVLKAVDAARSRGAKHDELDGEVEKQCKEHLGGDLRSADARRRDKVSHHILRLAYC